jgi:hypothetical protein
MRLSFSQDSVKEISSISLALNMCQEYRYSVSQLNFIQSVDKEILVKVLDDVIDYLK